MENNNTISYEALAKEVGNMVLFNQLPNVDTEWYEDVENYIMDEDSEEYPEIYQWYTITERGYDYLKEYTNEIIGYSEKLDIHYWCITHFGTGWSHVFTKITKQYE